MSQKHAPEEKTEASLKPLCTRSVVNSLSSGMVNPFTGAYAVKLGASSSLMGWFQSSSNISNNVMQVFWGRLSDRLGKRIPFIILGGLIVSALWIPMIFVTNATQLIILLAVQTLLDSMATPALTAIIGDLVPTSRFGRANLNIPLGVNRRSSRHAGSRNPNDDRGRNTSRNVLHSAHSRNSPRHNLIPPTAGHKRKEKHRKT